MKLNYAPGVKQIIRRERRTRMVKAIAKHIAIGIAWMSFIALWLGLK
jgi:hypothetical protein